MRPERGSTVPPAIPRGWYCVGAEDDLAPGRVRRERLFARELVSYRGASGELRLVDAHCPHLGAHLGYGGRVEGDLLRCPFHGFRFDLDGRCASTPYGYKPPPGARLGNWPLVRDQGLLFTWFDPDGAPPAWEPTPLDAGLPAGGWTRWRRGRWKLRTHPQETSENSVDFGHFSEIHGFHGARMTRPLALDGPRLSVGYAFRHRALGRHTPGGCVAVEIAIEVEGLGRSRVYGRLPGLGLEVHYLVLPTPRDGGRIDLRFASRARAAGRRPLARLLEGWLFLGLRRELRQDALVWERKRYLERPALARGDGPIAAYRRWCRQFYAGETRRTRTGSGRSGRRVRRASRPTSANASGSTGWNE